MTRRSIITLPFCWPTVPDDLALTRRLADLLATVRRHPLRVFILSDAWRAVRRKEARRGAAA